MPHLRGRSRRVGLRAPASSLPGISRALLVERLRRLEQTGVIVRRQHGHGSVEYHLTYAGRALQGIIDVLGGWGARWAFGDPRPRELDPVLLLWWMRRHVRREQFRNNAS